MNIDDLRSVLIYVRHVRKIICLRKHPGPDDACARCQIDAALKGEAVSTLVRNAAHANLDQGNAAPVFPAPHVEGAMELLQDFGRLTNKTDQGRLLAIARVMAATAV